MTPVRVFIVAGAMLSVASCSTTAIQGQPSATTVAPTSSAPQATRHTIAHPPPSERNNGTSFDPCEAFTDVDLHSVGLDPSTIKASDSSFVRGCNWDGVGWYAEIGVLNGPVDRYLDQNHFPGSQRITVAGLNGVTYRVPPDDVRGCFIELPSGQATVGTIVQILDPASAKISDGCVKAVEIATMLGPKLPK